tara:strand:+ start:124 stop:432 length:309 start_codon:yes stop_codon:yes gene_type:complete
VAVRIRLKRFGRIRKPIYRVVIMEKSSPRDGKTIEEVGFYDPTAQPKVVEINEDRVKHWLSVGAQPSDTVSRLLASKNLVEKQTRNSQNQKVAKKDREKSEE